MNSLFIVESLRPGNTRTGWKLYQDLDSIAATQGHTNFCSYYSIKTTQEFRTFLADRHAEALGGATFGLHIEAHGSQDGIQLGDYSIIGWPELFPLLIDINRALKNNLMLALSSCYGFFGWKLLLQAKGAPFCLIVGPKESIGPDALFEEFLNFYSTWISKSFVDAVKQLPQSGGDPFGALITSGALHGALKQVYETNSSEPARTINIQGTIAAAMKGGQGPLSKTKVPGLEQQIADSYDKLLLSALPQFYEKFMHADVDPDILQRMPFLPDLVFS